MVPGRDDPAATARWRDTVRIDTASLCASDQSVLPEGSERKLRQARAHADPRSDQFRGDHSRTLGGSLLGWKPAWRAAAFQTDAW